MAADRLAGTVTGFDVHVGLGTVKASTGETYPFHCVSIADGTRTIEVGTEVTFRVRFHVARDEATDIRPS